MAFVDESSKALVARCLTIAELPQWLAAQPPIDAEFFVWHHTFSPTEAQWRGIDSLVGCFNYFRDARGFEWAQGPQFWSAPDGVWIGHHPSLPNYVGATNWNDSGSRQVLHMETVFNGDAGPYTPDYLMQHALACVAICRWAGIPIQWVNIGPDGGALKTREGIAFHRQCYINGQTPKTCPGLRVTQTDVWAAIQRAAAEGDDDVANIDTVADATVQAEMPALVASGIIQNPSQTEHPWGDAASVGLVFTMIGRMAKKIAALEAASPKP